MTILTPVTATPYSATCTWASGLNGMKSLLSSPKLMTRVGYGDTQDTQPLSKVDKTMILGDVLGGLGDILSLFTRHDDKIFNYTVRFLNNSNFTLLSKGVKYTQDLKFSTTGAIMTPSSKMEYKASFENEYSLYDTMVFSFMASNLANNNVIDFDLSVTTAGNSSEPIRISQFTDHINGKNATLPVNGLVQYNSYFCQVINYQSEQPGMEVDLSILALANVGHGSNNEIIISFI
ncbi:hypothetical protein [Klebsiella aerogenes]|uniref:hypothetical protein n=1 Tax=Klebsiella aerogenes TaxID=548 RepID=UPI000D3A3954|nr:hypothetical protein [Klebsiella aerogenes]